ncbi:unnamed protein product [Callosobruchus maculatus]|uniref:Uncharacterized protein n=1 Tax=Callosobruchus maculatus TaxID=64391 RepID=A0A653CWA8_CALMS|nr:unnamed protein product [Callosobruchus maculatus]
MSKCPNVEMLKWQIHMSNVKPFVKCQNLSQCQNVRLC